MQDILTTLLDYFRAIQPHGLAAFGILLLGGVFGGMLANRVKWMPTITSFMLLGFLFGPHGLNFLTREMLVNSKILIDIALGLILYALGTLIHPAQIIKSRKLQITALSEAGLTFVACAIVVYMFGYSAVVALLIGAIAVSSSPAVLVHVSEELHADGPVARSAESLVAMNNLVSFLIFTMVLPFALKTLETSLFNVIVLPIYSLLSAVFVGLAVAWLAVKISKMLKPEEQHYRFALIIGAITLTLGITKMIAGSLLIAPLVLGTATRLFEKRQHKISDVQLGEGGDIFYIILFVMAGAKLHIEGILAAGLLPVVLVLVRSLCKFGGVMAPMRHTGIKIREGISTSLLLLPMAGMAIGLVTTLNELTPELGGKVAAIILSMVAIFETIGPFAAVKAFRLAGEVGMADAGEPARKEA